jgi:hypothetical protein
MIGPWTVISGITTVAMLPPSVNAETRKQAVELLADLATRDATIAWAIGRGSDNPAARRKLEAVIVAMGRVLIAAREVR